MFVRRAHHVAAGAAFEPAQLPFVPPLPPAVLNADVHV